jgi:putative transposase
MSTSMMKITFADATALQSLLDEFLVWYNEIRPHQHLQGATPIEAWRRIDYNKDRPRSMEWWSGWGGQLFGPRLRW